MKLTEIHRMQELAGMNQASGDSRTGFYRQFYQSSSEGVAKFHNSEGTWKVMIVDNTEDDEDLELEHKYFGMWFMQDSPGLDPDSVAHEFQSWFRNAGADFKFVNEPSTQQLPLPE